MEEPRQQAAKDEQEDRDPAGRREHLSGDAALGRLVHAISHVEERHQRDLWADADEQEQKTVDDDGGVDRRELRTLHARLPDPYSVSPIPGSRSFHAGPRGYGRS